MWQVWQHVWRQLYHYMKWRVYHVLAVVFWSGEEIEIENWLSEVWSCPQFGPQKPIRMVGNKDWPGSEIFYMSPSIRTVWSLFWCQTPWQPNKQLIDASCLYSSVPTFCVSSASQVIFLTHLLFLNLLRFLAGCSRYWCLNVRRSTIGGTPSACILCFVCIVNLGVWAFSFDLHMGDVWLLPPSLSPTSGLSWPSTGLNQYRYSDSVCMLILRLVTL